MNPSTDRPIKDHPGHHDKCPCETVYPLIQEGYKYGRKWKILEKKLTEEQKAQLNDKSLSGCHQIIYRKWGKLKIEHYTSSAPKNWPPEQAKEFFQWMRLSDDVQNKLLRKSRRTQVVVNRHLNSSPTPSTTAPTSDRQGLRTLIEASETLRPVTTEKETEPSKETESSKNKEIDRTRLALLNSVLDIDPQRHPSHEDLGRLRCGKINKLVSDLNNIDLPPYKKAIITEQLLQIAMIYFDQKTSEREIRTTINILAIIQRHISKLSPISSDNYHNLLKRVADCSFNGDFTHMIQLEYFIRQSRPEIAAKFRKLIPASKIKQNHTAPTSVAHPSRPPSSGPAKTPTPSHGRPIPGRTATRPPPAPWTLTPPHGRPIPGRTATRPPGRVLAPRTPTTTTPRSLTPSAPSTFAGMKRQHLYRLTSLTGYAKSLIGDRETTTLEEKKSKIKILQSTGDCLSEIYSTMEREIFAKIDPVIGALFRDISTEKRTKRPAETDDANPKSRKRPAVIIDSTDDDV